jgi:carbonic anhydrase
VAIQQLVAGVHHFQSRVFEAQKELFERLAKGQNPETLFITCSDSRIDPNLITHTDPGDLFVLRNAGNIVPAYGILNGGEVATIEFALTGLEVKHIVICGHTHCGAVKGLLNLNSLTEMPAMAEFLKHAESARRIVRAMYPNLQGEALHQVATEENVLTQLENLQTHPAVAVALAQGKLNLHGWVYDIEEGEVYGYDPGVSQFQPLGELRPAGTAAPARVMDVRSGDARFRPTSENAV